MSDRGAWARNHPGTGDGCGDCSRSSSASTASCAVARWLHASTDHGPPTRKEKAASNRDVARPFGRAGCPGTDLTGPPPPKLEDGIGVLMNNIPGSRRMFGSNSTWLHASKTRAVLLLGLWPYGYRFHVSTEDRFQMFSSELKLLVKCSVRVLSVARWSSFP